MSVKLKEYDVKMLVKRLEVEVGRPMSNYAASTAINVILKWAQKSIILSENKVDDVILALYPALIKFLSKKIDLKEFKGEFELEKEWDLKILLKELETYGLVVVEESIVKVIEICLQWVKESAELSENPYDDVIGVIIPVIMQPLNKLVNGISKDIESNLELKPVKKVAKKVSKK